MAGEPHNRVLFITGKLAEPALRRVLGTLDVNAEVIVMPITVAALLTTDWVVRHMEPVSGFSRVILPGLCRGELEPLETHLKAPVERGPDDLRDLPSHFGRGTRIMPTLDASSIEIIAEINHAPQLSGYELFQQAKAFRNAGADIIDLGCDPGNMWDGISDATKTLVDEGFRVSVDSFQAPEVTLAVRAGAELVLSVNETNIDHVVDWLAINPHLEVVAIPNTPNDLESLDRIVERLNHLHCRFRLDPILEPIGFGFAASLGRYLQTRQRYPKFPMMMGVGNLTELTECDTGGVNVLLAGFCQEQNIDSVLTTSVAPWCVTAVKEFDLARKLVHVAVRDGVPPKRLGSELVLLRDGRMKPLGEEALQELARQLTDRNYRIFAESDEIHILNGQGYWHGPDPFQLFAEVAKSDDKLDPSHSFYLGYEFAKAVTALQLGKAYEQDRALKWGFLTRPEPSGRQRPEHK